MSSADDGTRRPRLSIVVAARENEGGARACVDALGPQVDGEVEVIVASDTDAAGWAPDWARCCSRPGALVPELWAAGLHEARGELVGLLAGNVVPDPDWVQRTFELHRDGTAGIGGPIEPGAGLGPVDWAVYFCRYAAYELPIPSPDRLEVPGDNASYRGEILRRYQDLYEDGFWEPFVHRALRDDGHVLQMRSERIARLRSGARTASFRRQRFEHGQRNGELRSAGLERARIATEMATTPLVPALMTFRAGRTVFARRRHRLRFLAVSPLVLWFYGWWAVGELAGRLRVVVGRRQR
jgi:hypothetical protein